MLKKHATEDLGDCAVSQTLQYYAFLLANHRTEYCKYIDAGSQ